MSATVHQHPSFPDVRPANDQRELFPVGAVRQERPGKRDVIAIGGGKGGIGKSLLAANMAVRLAGQGKRVVLVDADLGGANLHTCLGIPAPRVTLSDFIVRRVKTLEATVVPTPIHNLGLISGALDFLGAANPKHTQKLRLLREIISLHVDVVLIDLGGGTGFNILDFFLIADHGILTVVPEPTSIENAYRFIKAAYYRRLKTIELSLELRPVVDDALEHRGELGLQTPADLVRHVESVDAAGGQLLREELNRFPFNLVVNQCRSPQEHALGESISKACERYFGIHMNFLGSIPYDDAVWQSVRKRQPVLISSPQSKASQSIASIVDALKLEAGDGQHLRA